MFIKILILLSIIYFMNTKFINSVVSFDYCENSEKNASCSKKYSGHLSSLSKNRYILYDVNTQEGFNLRRDVYIRAVIFVKQLNEKDKKYQWNLVLPPWGPLYHWKSSNIKQQKQIPWSKFFDIESLKKYAPVMEMYQFMKEHGRNVIDCVYVLQNDKEMFETGNFEEKNIINNCPKTSFPYKKQNNGEFSGLFWGYTNITASKVKCLTFHGTILNLNKNLYPDQHRTVMFDHLEIALHHVYGSSEYWKARRSMRYNLKLYEIANQFRLVYLNSNDIDDNTHKPDDWRMEEKTRTATGGPYLAVHFRRQDFLYGHAESTPSIKKAASQIEETLKTLKLNVVFIATDTSEEEFKKLEHKLMNYTVLRFAPTKTIKEHFQDGGIAIIDQIICSHARYFLGTHESTFSFRIQEDREILGFPVNTTFNRLCENDAKCSGNKWEIEWN